MIITGFAFDQWPTVLQIIGMVIGFLGVNIFIFAKSDDKSKNKEEADEKNEPKKVAPVGDNQELVVEEY